MKFGMGFLHQRSNVVEAEGPAQDEGDLIH